MATINLDLNQRQHLAVIVGSAQGTPAEVKVYYEILKAIDLSEEEKKAINFQQSGDMIVWEKGDLPAHPYSFSSEHIAKLKAALTGWRFFRAKDQEWLPQVLDQL
jgi:hypothetical protein